MYLNCWHGKLESKLINYIKDSSESIDIFCLQEVPIELQTKISKIIQGYGGIYKSIPINSNFVNNYGQSIFVKNKIKIIKSEHFDIFLNRKPNYGFLQVVDIEFGGKKFCVSNIHGRSQPGHKNDTLTRIIQSQNIIKLLSQKNIPKILGGDFNLNAETKSIKLIEDAGFVNLISKYEIRTTRNSLAWNTSKKNGQKGIVKYYKKQNHADYCFITSDITVNNFSVPEIMISDHLPLILDFSV